MSSRKVMVSSQGGSRKCNVCNGDEWVLIHGRMKSCPNCTGPGSVELCNRCNGSGFSTIHGRFGHCPVCSGTCYVPSTTNTRSHSTSGRPSGSGARHY